MKLVEKINARVFDDEEKAEILDSIDELRDAVKNDKVRQVAILGLSGSNGPIDTDHSFEHTAIADNTNPMLMVGLMEVVKLSIIAKHIDVEGIPVE